MLYKLGIDDETFQKITTGRAPYVICPKSESKVETNDYYALAEYDGKTGKYTGRFTVTRITDVLRGSVYLKPGHIIITVSPCQIMQSSKYNIYPGTPFAADDDLEEDPYSF